jgi:hypothetical protein
MVSKLVKKFTAIPGTPTVITVGQSTPPPPTDPHPEPDESSAHNPTHF